MLHLRTHPEPIEGCFGCRLTSINIAPSAMATRSDAATAKAREKRWNRDIPAYKRLRADGLQPGTVDGAGDLEARANHEAEVTMGWKIDKPNLSRVTESLKYP